MFESSDWWFLVFTVALEVQDRVLKAVEETNSELNVEITVCCSVEAHIRRGEIKSTYRPARPQMTIALKSMIDPQWNMMYWRSRCNFHTVCWGAVGFEWATTSVYFGITFVCSIPRILPVFVVGSQFQHRFFIYVKKISFEGHKQNLQKIPCTLKSWMGLVIQILIKLETSFIRAFLQLSHWCPLGNDLS